MHSTLDSAHLRRRSSSWAEHPYGKKVRGKRARSKETVLGRSSSFRRTEPALPGTHPFECQASYESIKSWE